MPENGRSSPLEDLLRFMPEAMPDLSKMLKTYTCGRGHTYQGEGPFKALLQILPNGQRVVSGACCPYCYGQDIAKKYPTWEVGSPRALTSVDAGPKEGQDAADTQLVEVGAPAEHRTPRERKQAGEAGGGDRILHPAAFAGTQAESPAS